MGTSIPLERNSVSGANSDSFVASSVIPAEKLSLSLKISQII